MKKIKKYIVLNLLVVLGIVFSCQDMNDVHQDYIKDGEIKYTNKVDSLNTFPGKERVLISGFISGAFNVDEIVVTWNEGAEMQLFPYSKSTNDTDALELQIDGLEEKSYQFKIYSKDAEGNKSVPVTIFGTAYGETYRLTLESRAINTFTYDHDFSSTLNFKPSSDLTRNTEVKYLNLSGEEIVKTVLPDESAVVMEQIDIDQPIRWRTFYVPTPMDEEGNETAIDEFDSNWETFTTPADTFKPILDSFSMQSLSGGVTASWENNGNQEIEFNFQYILGGGSASKVKNSSASTDSYTVSPMDSGEQVLVIKLINVYGDSWARAYTVNPI